MELQFKVLLPMEQGPAALARKIIDDEPVWVGMTVRFPFSDGHYLDIKIGDVRKDYEEGMDSMHVQVVRSFLDKRTRGMRWFFADAPREDLFQRWQDAGWEIADYSGDGREL